MIVSVTALGSRDGDTARAVGRVVNYLDGRAPERPGRSPQWWSEQEFADKAPCEHGLGGAGDGAVGYYADSVEGPGVWLGRGLAGFSPSGEVARAELALMLGGQHPASGHQLLNGSGSAARADHLGRDTAKVAARGPDDELLTIPQAASLLGVSPQYLRKVLAKTTTARAEADVPEPGDALPALEGPYLDAARATAGGHWHVTRAEVARFAEDRQAPTAVIGYDLTFSAPKSVSLLWATGDAARQGEVVAALDAAVAAGFAYLEENAAFVRSDSGTQVHKANGLLAASYVHGTSRALDPQLHAHVVVANMAEGPDGSVRALDGRPLFAHAKTASYLAAAELRTQMAARLGVEWEPAERGLADVAGVPRPAITEMSKRSRELDAVVGGLESFYTAGNGLGAKGRQMAAYLTRAAKEDHGVDPESLRPWWSAQLGAVGFGPEAFERCYDRQSAPALVTEDDRRALLGGLGSMVTEHAATFGRREVIQQVADWAGDRMDAKAICDLADIWLAKDVVVRLNAPGGQGRSSDVVRLANGRTLSSVGDEALYTTTHMLAIEERIFSTYEAGRHARAGVVPKATLEAVLAARPELGEDQEAMVRSICTSGRGVQCVLGPAGSGKTYALAAAAKAWRDAGYRTLGAVVAGAATEVLRDATAMECSTAASLLWRLGGGAEKLDKRSVVIVDEASTLANADLAELADHVAGAGATLRLIGDPAQHSAVAAGGAFRLLLQRYPDDKAELVERRRQAAPEMTEVRLASIDYAAGKISQAVERLRNDDRVVEADTPDDLLDDLTADWYVDRLGRQANPALAASSMVADHHVERRELNARARALLAADGTLRGPAVEVAGQSFQAGDEVVAKAQDKKRLRPSGTPWSNYVRNGERGHVVEVCAGEHPSVVVDFQRRGRVTLDEELLSRQIHPGLRGVIAHSYAVTSHGAQGETYHAGRHLSTDASTRQGVYVGLTRGRGDARLYMVRQRDLVPRAEADSGLPRLEDQSATVAAITHRLETQRDERLAHELDPSAREVARLANSHDLAELAALASDGDQSAARAYRQSAEALASAACVEPDPAMVARLGPRPEGGSDRHSWDRAVGGAAVYQARWGARPINGGAGASWAIGAAPGTGEARAHYGSVAGMLVGAERCALAALPTPELANQRRVVQRLIAGGPSPARRDELEVALDNAHQRLRVAEKQRHHAGKRLEAGEKARRRHRNPQSIELARRDVGGAEQRCATASLEVTRAEQALGAFDQHQPAQEALRARLEVLDGALERQIAGAVATPGAYLTNVIGPAPDDVDEAHPWHERATRIEGFRHRHLGISPADGPVLDHDDALIRAIGERPTGYLDAIDWDHVAVGLEAELGPHIEELGMEL